MVVGLFRFEMVYFDWLLGECLCMLMSLMDINEFVGLGICRWSLECDEIVSMVIEGFCGEYWICRWPKPYDG